MNNRHETSDNKLLLTLTLAVALTGGVWLTRNGEQKRTSEAYSTLPTTNVMARVGQGIESLTGEFVDTAKYDSSIRTPEFMKDNCLSEPVLQATEEYRVHYDREYVAEKSKKTH